MIWKLRRASPAKLHHPFKALSELHRSGMSGKCGHSQVTSGLLWSHGMSAERSLSRVWRILLCRWMPCSSLGYSAKPSSCKSDILRSRGNQTGWSALGRGIFSDARKRSLRVALRWQEVASGRVHRWLLRRGRIFHGAGGTGIVTFGLRFVIGHGRVVVVEVVFKNLAILDRRDLGVGLVRSNPGGWLFVRFRGIGIGHRHDR